MKEKTYKIYVHKNKTNNKVYVGQTTQSLENRAGGKNATFYIRQDNEFAKDIVKYGWENFEHSIIYETCDSSEADILEAKLIKEYDSTNPEKGYNRTTGGKTNYQFSDSIKTVENSISNLMTLRIKKNLSQSQLARLSGLKTRTIQSLDTKKSDIEGARLDIMLPLIKVLGCRMSDVLEDSPTKTLLLDYEKRVAEINKQKKLQQMNDY